MNVTLSPRVAFPTLFNSRSLWLVVRDDPATGEIYRELWTCEPEALNRAGVLVQVHPSCRVAVWHQGDLVFWQA